MAARGNITLTDGASTPVNHVFKPSSPPKTADSNVLFWRDSTQAIWAGQAVLSVSQRVADKSTNATKVSWKLETPVLEQTSPSTSTGIQPAPQVAYTPLAKVEFTLPDRASEQERKDLLTMLRDLIDEAIVTSQVEDLELIW